MPKFIKIKIKKKQRKKESKTQKIDNPKPTEKETTKGERRSFGVARGPRGFNCHQSTPRKHTHISNQRTKGKREALVRIMFSLSLSLSLKSFCHVWDIPVCHDRISDIPKFFSKKKKKKKEKDTHQVRILGVSYQYSCRTRVLGQNCHVCAT